MTKLTDFFGHTTEFVHPRLRSWKHRLSKDGTTAVLEVYVSAKDFGQTLPEMNLQFSQNGNLSPLETFPWDDDLNSGLIQLQVKCVTPDNEAQRFSLGLRAALRKAEREFGDGYFNSVLVELLQDSDLTARNEIKDVLKHIPALKPHQGKSYHLCREMISDAIAGRAKELTASLRYSQDEAQDILVKTIAHYLDDRFSVSSRRRLGLLR